MLSESHTDDSRSKVEPSVCAKTAAALSVIKASEDSTAAGRVTIYAEKALLIVLLIAVRVRVQER